MQATLLYHPILPNQREHQLFDRYFGFGYAEEAMLYEACVDGVVGEACNAYLPCLQVVRPASGAAASDIRRDAEARPAGDVVYELPAERLPSGDRRDPLLLQELRARFHRARSLDPLPLHYSEEDINIAIHARRGDVVDAARHHSRLTDDAAFGNLTATLLHHLRKYNLFGSALQNGRIKIHLFSQGSKVRQAARVHVRWAARPLAGTKHARARLPRGVDAPAGGLSVALAAGRRRAPLLPPGRAAAPDALPHDHGRHSHLCQGLEAERGIAVAAAGDGPS